MNQKVTLVVRILVGLIMVVFGANKFLNFMPQPTEIPEQMGALMGILMTSPFMTIIGVLEVLGGLGLILNKFVPLSLTVLIAVLLNAALFHLFFDPANVVGALVFLLLCLVLVYGYKDRFKSLLTI
ncbi:MAG: DoxX family protein [Bacteroidia bacterium]